MTAEELQEGSGNTTGWSHQKETKHLEKPKFPDEL